MNNFDNHKKVPPNNANISQNTKTDLPGELQGSTQMTVQSWQCAQLVRGRKQSDSKPAILGLLAFSTKVNIIYTAAALDDPYADKFLIDIETAIEESKNNISATYSTIQNKLDSTEGVSIEVATSKKPIIVNLTFANPFGYQAAYLLATYDLLVLAAMTAKHVSKILPQEARAIIEAYARNIRSIFHLPSGYKYLAIKREDVHQNTARAIDAKTKMGPIPDGILSADIRSASAPKIKTQTIQDQNTDAMALNEEPELAQA